MSCYLESNNKEDCNGCGICALKCPVGAIAMQEDNEGFLYPIVDKKICINCGKCSRECSNEVFTKNKGKSYYAYSIKERETSSSGGIFPVLASKVFDVNGLVCGVQYNENMEAIHNIARNMQEAKKFKGSKYVRSNINGVYQQIKSHLENGTYILFVGTPCQVNGLKLYLDKEYNNLLLCDIICHANPSPKVLKKYIEYIEKKEKKKVIDINFRDKRNGWHKPITSIKLDGGREILDNIFFRAFSIEAIHRPSCYKCKFTSQERVSDITIADFWGIDKFVDKIDDDKGISLVLVNTEKGDEFFDLIKRELVLNEMDIENPLQYNHNKPVVPHKNRTKIFSKIDDKNFIRYLKKYTTRPIPIRLISKCIPLGMKQKIVKILHK